MSFKISEFKATLDSYGGPAHRNLFEVIFSNVAGGNRVTSRDLTFFCSAAAMPGMQADVAVYQGVAQKPKTFVRGLNHDQVSCNFMLDSDHEIKTFFHLWMQRVVNYGTAGGYYSAIDNDMMPYEIGYKDEYACRMTMRHYSTTNLYTFYEVILDNVFPVAVGDVDLAWDAEGVASMTVGFEYDRIEYSGERRGNPFARYGRGNGLLSMLNSIGTINQALDVGNRPLSTQDALNRLYGIGYAADTIGNFFNT